MAITEVQKKDNGVSSGTTNTITMTSGVTQGNLLVATVLNGGTGVTVTAPDGSWTKAVSANFSGGTTTGTEGLWWRIVDAGLAGTTSFTWTLAAAHTFNIYMSEWHATNGWPGTPTDQTASLVKVLTTTADSGTTATTTQAEELWLAGVDAGGNATFSGLTSGWTQDSSLAPNGSHRSGAFFEIASATGVAHVTFTLSAAEDTAGTVATFKDSTGSAVASNTTLLLLGVG